MESPKPSLCRQNTPELRVAIWWGEAGTQLCGLCVIHWTLQDLVWWDLGQDAVHHIQSEGTLWPSMVSFEDRRESQARVKEETEQALSFAWPSCIGRWRSYASLGWGNRNWFHFSLRGAKSVDFELYAQYLWKWHTNWKTRPPKGRVPGLSIT